MGMLAAFHRIAWNQSPDAGRRVAITIDDGPVVGAGDNPDLFQKITSGLIESFRAEQVPVIVFINERQLNVPGQRDARAAAIEQWLDAGFDVGNHAYSHPDLNRTPLPKYTDDIVKGEVIMRPLIERRGRKLVWFRHPYLHTGPTAEIAKRLQEFLDERGYRVAPVTVDYSDYTFAGVYSRLLRRGDLETAEKVRQAYLAQVDLGFDHAEGVSRDVLGYELPQILLIHCNELNSVSLRESIARIRKRGYRFVSLDQAMEDPAYRRPHDYVGAGGISWLRRWALSTGKEIPPSPPLPDWLRGIGR
jgi:peptidoglycan/xylan/chitin deacetylase (PgdA/CDA1 family)